MRNLFQRFLHKRTLEPVAAIFPSVKSLGSDLYLLECWNQYQDVPAILLPYVDRIKTRQEWESLGFIFEFNSHGQVRKLKVANRYFSFIEVKPAHAVELEAVRTGKRLTQNPDHIRILLSKGCDPGEFLHIPVDLLAFEVISTKKTLFKN